MTTWKLSGLGSQDYTELFNPKPVGEKVNVHVHQSPPEPLPDYDAMKRFTEDPDYALVFSPSS